MVNTHGLKIKGLRAASGATINWKHGGHTQVNYDTETGEMLTHDHESDYSWSAYHSSSVILVCNTKRHMTMQELADKTKEAYDEAIYQAQFIKA